MQRFDTDASCPYHARAMGSPLRDRRPLAELAERRQVIEINDKVSEFQRLAGIVEADLAALEPARRPPGWRDSGVSGRLEFGFLDAREQLVVLEGEVSATIDAVCQRCLEPFRLELASRLHLLPMVARESAFVDDTLEVWELDDEMICPADVVEEALIMAMPFAAVHEDAVACREFDTSSGDETETSRTFAGLKSKLDENR
jgi:uncharacterized protein